MAQYNSCNIPTQHSSHLLCPIATAQHGMDYKITVGRNFFSILMKLCTEVGGLKSKKAFIWGQNPIIPYPILLQFFTPITHFQWEGPDTAVTRPVN